MHILQVISKFYHSGAESLVYTLSSLFKKEGYQVTVVSFYKNENAEEEFNIVDSLECQGIHCIKLNKSKKQKLSLIKDLRSLIKKNKYSVIHAHAFQPNFYSRLASLFTDVPVVITYHSASNDWSSFKGKYLEKLVDPYTAARVAVSKIPVNFYRTHISNYNKIIEIPNGIVLTNKDFNTEDKKAVRDSIGIGQNDLFLLNVGRIVKQKGQIYLLDAINYLVNELKINNIRLAIAGLKQDLHLVAQLENKIKEYKLQRHVFLLGSRNDVEDLLLSADIFVFPSVAEAHPIALIEAVNANIPIVSSDIEANKLAFSENCLFFSPVKNSVELAEVIRKVIENPDLAKKKVIESRKEITKYSIINTMKEYENIYKNVQVFK